MPHRLLIPLPTALRPRIVIDERDWTVGFPFYMRHLYPLSTTPRRVLARALTHVPRAVLWRLLPDTWLVAGRARQPGPVPTTIVGAPSPEGELKLVDWDRGTVTGSLRTTGEQVRVERLVDGWSAERWTTWPLRSAGRDERRTRLMASLGAYLRSLHLPEREPEVHERSLADARRGLASVGSPLARAWCTDLLGRFAASPPVPQAREHGDLQLRNLVVRPDGRLEAIDRPYDEQRAIAGTDATTALADLLSRWRGEEWLDLGAATDALDRVPDPLRTAVGRFLVTALATADADALADALAFAVLRSARHHAAYGTDAFLEAAARGRLHSGLERVLEGA
ncbi:hypothetical protein [Miltoncostaea marina]|uniref:hypothetical protein n=1 Tax=Miltoncostaea marina TaxID=2843215 RepID=UPI001C3C840E|nr:hypothetical protein [Miltoncostaea marina]